MKPAYTADAMQARVQGTVVVEAVVLPNGTVGDVKVIKSLDKTHGLDSEAVKAAKQWRFVPGTRDNKPVPVIVSIELTFTLADKNVLAPLEWPKAFVEEGQPGQESAEEIAEGGDFIVRLIYPKGWALTRPAGGQVWFAVDAPDSEAGITVMRPQASAIPGAARFSTAMMSSISKTVGNAFATNPTMLRATGQIVAANRLWFWYEAWVPASDPTFFGYAAKEAAAIYDGAFLWSFTYPSRGREITVQCSSLRARSASPGDAQDRQRRAASQCRTAIERISIERR